MASCGEWRAERVENLLDPLPDVYYQTAHAAGWIELKTISTLPVRPTSKLTISTLTLVQASVLKHYDHPPVAPTWLLLQGENSVFLFHGKDASTLFAGVTLDVAVQLSVCGRQLKRTSAQRLYDLLDGQENGQRS